VTPHAAKLAVRAPGPEPFSPTAAADRASSAGFQPAAPSLFATGPSARPLDHAGRLDARDDLPKQRSCQVAFGQRAAPARPEDPRIGRQRTVLKPRSAGRTDAPGKGITRVLPPLTGTPLTPDSGHRLRSRRDATDSRRIPVKRRIRKIRASDRDSPAARTVGIPMAVARAAFADIAEHPVEVEFVA